MYSLKGNLQLSLFPNKTAIANASETIKQCHECEFGTQLWGSVAGLQGEGEAKACGRPDHPWPDRNWVELISLWFWISGPGTNVKPKPRPGHYGATHQRSSQSLSHTGPDGATQRTRPVPAPAGVAPVDLASLKGNTCSSSPSFF